MDTNWINTNIEFEFSEKGTDCYRLTCANYLNDYFIVSNEQSRNLMNHPEIVGYDVYKSLLDSTIQMLHYFNDKKKISCANILSILRGALNFPLEEACCIDDITVHDISFISCERTFNENNDVDGLATKYSKINVIPNSTLMIGDILASGETFRQCLQKVIDCYRKQGAELKNVVLFTIGGTKGISLLEKFTKEIREYWSDFEGFITIYYEGIFSCYEPGDKGVSGINRSLIDFIWKDGIIAPEFRSQTLSEQYALFEKCYYYYWGWTWR